MDGVEPTQGFEINITEIILLYLVGSEYVEVYVNIWDRLQNYNVVF